MREPRIARSLFRLINLAATSMQTGDTSFRLRNTKTSFSLACAALDSGQRRCGHSSLCSHTDTPELARLGPRASSYRGAPDQLRNGRSQVQLVSHTHSRANNKNDDDDDEMRIGFGEKVSCNSVMHYATTLLRRPPRVRSSN